MKKSGLIIKDVIFYSTEFQFLGSEQYKRNISLTANRNKKSIFTKKQIKRFREKANKLNKNKQGDQAAFYLMRKDLK